MQRALRSWLPFLCCVGLVPAQRELQVPMQDGVELAADLWLPDGDGPWPAILIQTPYGKRRMAAVTLGGRGPIGAAIDREQYAVVVVDWRGFFGSKAAANGRRRLDRGADGFDCVEWIAAQPWCNGKVGTYGGSALGHQQFATAAKRPPHLVCAVPLIAPPGLGYSRFYRGGVRLESQTSTLARLGFGPMTGVARAPYSGMLPWRVADRAFRPESFDVPVLMIAGWWDLYPDEILDGFARLVAEGGEPTRAHSRLLIGPWDHLSVDLPRTGDRQFEAAAGEAARWTRAFFDRWLRGIDGAPELPRIRYFQAGEERWVDVTSWPGVPVETRGLALHPDGRLDASRPEAGTRSWRHDPSHPVPTLGGGNLPPLPRGPTDHRALAERADVLAYATAPLAEPLRLAGRIRVELRATIDRADADFAVWVCDVDPDGRALLVQDGIRRASLRSATDEPAPVEPGVPFTVAVDLPAIAYTVPPGHRLQLFVGSANWPRYERNAHDGSPQFDAGRALPLEVRLQHGGAAPSRLLLPVVTGN